MVKYFKFFIPALTVVLAMYICTIGSYYSILFFTSFTVYVKQNYMPEEYI